MTSVPNNVHEYFEVKLRSARGNIPIRQAPHGMTPDPSKKHAIVLEPGEDSNIPNPGCEALIWSAKRICIDLEPGRGSLRV